MTRISSEDAVSTSPSPAHPLPLDDGLFFAVKRMEVDPALMWTTRSCLDDEGPFIVFNEILCCGLHMMWRARTVYTIFGIPGISSSVAATEKKPDSLSTMRERERESEEISNGDKESALVNMKISSQLTTFTMSDSSIRLHKCFSRHL